MISLEALEQHAAQAAQTIGDSGDNLDAHLDARYALSAACDPATIQALTRAVRAALDYTAFLRAPDSTIHELDAALQPFREQT